MLEDSLKELVKEFARETLELRKRNDERKARWWLFWHGYDEDDPLAQLMAWEWAGGRYQ